MKAMMECRNPKQETTACQVLFIKEIFLGDYTESIRFRVTLKKLSEAEGGADIILGVHGIDASGEIALKAFEEDTRKILDAAKVNMCYSLISFRVQRFSRGFPSPFGKKLEVHVTANSKMKEITDACIPPIPFHFKTVAEIAIFSGSYLTAVADVVGIVVKNDGLQSTQNGLSFRDLTVADATHQRIRLRLWENDAVDFGDCSNQCIAVRKTKIMKFDDANYLSAFAFTLIWTNPDAPEKTDILSAYDASSNDVKEL